MPIPQSGGIWTGFAPRHRSRASSGVKTPVIVHSGTGRDGYSEDDPESQNQSNPILQTCLDIGIVLLIVVFLRLFIMAPFVIPSGSMEDTLGINDRILTTNGLTRSLVKPRRGDVVVFTDPANWLGNDSQTRWKSNYLVKRLIGMPGDTVACQGHGAPVTVNGVALDESAYLKKGTEPSSFPFEATVKANHVFVLGDNRANSADSRYHLADGDQGQVPIENIKGTAMLTYYPISSWKLLNNKHAVFDGVADRQPRQAE